MSKLDDFLAGPLTQFAGKLSSNKVISALMEGFIRTSPITLGIALITIVGNFPIPAWTEWLSSIGLTDDITAITNGATGVMTLYVVYSVAMAYGSRLGLEQKARNAALISLASFIMIMPQTVTTMVEQDGQLVESAVNALSLDYLGGQGLFVGMILTLVVTRAYAWLSGKKLMFNLPPSVPPMVADSLSPIFVVTIIFLAVFAVRVGMSFTPAGDLITFFINTINAPLLGITASPVSIIVIQGLLSSLWFFGIHNAVLQGPLAVVSVAMVTGNIQAFMADEPLPFLTTSVVYLGMQMASFRGHYLLRMMKMKSAKFRQIAKLCIVPSIFNIDEPFVFGMPVVLNPMLAIPQCLTQPLVGLITWGLTFVLPLGAYNPTFSLAPWTMPLFIKLPLAGGLSLVIIMLVALVVSYLMWVPFLKAADRKAYEEEQRYDAERAASAEGAVAVADSANAGE